MNLQRLNFRLAVGLIGFLFALNLSVRAQGQDPVPAAAGEDEPERIYLNVYESKRLDFDAAVDEVNIGRPDVLRARQPLDNVLILEGLRIDAASQGGGVAGFQSVSTSGQVESPVKTTMNVVVGNKIKRYIVTVMPGREGDEQSILQVFKDKKYDNLKVGFSDDIATINGSVLTQEELDDAVRIVKTYTPYVENNAYIGAPKSSSMTIAEQLLANRIKEIANVKGLDVLVEGVSNIEIVQGPKNAGAGGAQAGAGGGAGGAGAAAAGTAGTPGGRVSAGAAESPTTTNQQLVTSQVANAARIYLMGELADDLDKARALRTARMYTNTVISFLTVKDPIQLRVALKFLELDLNKAQTVGFTWPTAFSYNVITAAAGLPITASQPNSVLNRPSGGSLGDQILSQITQGLTTDVSTTLTLLETSNIGTVLNEPSISLLNGQAGTFFNGQNIPYISGISGTSVNLGNAGQVPLATVSYLPVGVSILIVPLKTSIEGQTGGAKAFTDLSTFPNTSTAGGAASGGATGSIPAVLPNISNYDDVMASTTGATVDDSIKYVDENGLIGMNIRSTISSVVQFTDLGSLINEVPQTAEKNISTRAVLRDGQSIVVAGLFDDNITKAIQAVPYLSKIPIFGFLFKQHADKRTRDEILLVFTPTIVRLSDPDSNRVPKPRFPETQQYLTEGGMVPKIKPVRYDVAGIDLRPDSATAPMPLLKAEPQPLPAVKPEETVAPAPASPPPAETPVQDVAPAPVVAPPADSTPQPNADAQPQAEKPPENVQPVIDTAPPANNTAAPAPGANNPSLLP